MIEEQLITIFINSLDLDKEKINLFSEICLKNKIEFKEFLEKNSSKLRNKRIYSDVYQTKLTDIFPNEPRTKIQKIYDIHKSNINYYSFNPFKEESKYINTTFQENESNDLINVKDVMGFSGINKANKSNLSIISRESGISNSFNSNNYNFNNLKEKLNDKKINSLSNVIKIENHQIIKPTNLVQKQTTNDIENLNNQLIYLNAKPFLNTNKIIFNTCSDQLNEADWTYLKNNSFTEDSFINNEESNNIENPILPSNQYTHGYIDTNPNSNLLNHETMSNVNLINENSNLSIFNKLSNNSRLGYNLNSNNKSTNFSNMSFPNSFLKSMNNKEKELSNTGSFRNSETSMKEKKILDQKEINNALKDKNYFNGNKKLAISLNGNNLKNFNAKNNEIKIEENEPKKGISSLLNTINDNKAIIKNAMIINDNYTKMVSSNSLAGLHGKLNINAVTNIQKLKREKSKKKDSKLKLALIEKLFEKLTEKTEINTKNKKSFNEQNNNNGNSHRNGEAHDKIGKIDKNSDDKIDKNGNNLKNIVKGSFYQKKFDTTPEKLDMPKFSKRKENSEVNTESRINNDSVKIDKKNGKNSDSYSLLRINKKEARSMSEEPILKEPKKKEFEDSIFNLKNKKRSKSPFVSKNKNNSHFYSINSIDENINQNVILEREEERAASDDEVLAYGTPTKLSVNDKIRKRSKDMESINSKSMNNSRLNFINLFKQIKK